MLATNLTSSLLLATFLVISALALPQRPIVGGEVAERGQFPHQVSVLYQGSHYCGGSIISNNYILTAFHCVGQRSPADYSIRAGSLNHYRGGVVINVVEIKLHPEYNYLIPESDLALLKLENSLGYNSYIWYIPLATSPVPVGEDVIISGWGFYDQTLQISEVLRWTTLTALSREECSAQINIDSEKLLCLAHQGFNGACSMDSGGPAVYNDKLVGVSSFVWSTGCGSSKPDGYAEITTHLAWIRENAEM